MWLKTRNHRSQESRETVSLSVDDVTLPRGEGDLRKEPRGPSAHALVRRLHILPLKTRSLRF